MDDQKNLMEEAVKEALAEWLDKQFQTFGKWSLMTLVAFLLVGLTYMIFWVNGWRQVGG